MNQRSRGPSRSHQGHQARKRFGQNFLVDETVIYRIVRAIHPRPSDMLVEIGPGLGALTRPLADEVDHLHVVELDRDLAARLRADESLANRLTVHEVDALRFDFAALANGGKLRVCGNLPYNISTPLIFHLLEHVDTIGDMHFMLQKEVVERLAAAPGCADFGRLTIMVQYHCQVEAVVNVPPGSFQPPPKVDSAVVRLTPHAVKPHVATDPALLGRICGEAFTQRRKTLRNALRNWIDAEGLAALGIDAGLRPEDLSVGDYVAIANVVAARPPSSGDVA